MPTYKRRLIRWELFDGTLVEMYINPNNITFSQNKKISKTRTKGGFLVQYWGEELMTIQLQGTTGSAGIEGIQLLEDVYRSEQLSLQRLKSIDNTLLNLLSGDQRLNRNLGENSLEQFRNKRIDRKSVV